MPTTAEIARAIEAIDIALRQAGDDQSKLGKRKMAGAARLRRSIELSEKISELRAERADAVKEYWLASPTDLRLGRSQARFASHAA